MLEVIYKTIELYALLYSGIGNIGALVFKCCDGFHNFVVSFVQVECLVLY